MITLYFIAILLLFCLAVFDLSVGVSNDAVNFLNSSIGSKAFRLKKIMIIASVGIFVGAAFSGGMMDIARHGIFQPQYFHFDEIMAILMGVMLRSDNDYRFRRHFRRRRFFRRNDGYRAARHFSAAVFSLR